jgi:hypothetical protein
VNFQQDLPKIYNIDETLLVHNNFGICSQMRYQAVSQGLARVKAHFVNKLSQGSSQILETSFAEIAVYDSLIQKSPSFANFFSDL